MFFVCTVCNKMMFTPLKTLEESLIKSKFVMFDFIYTLFMVVNRPFILAIETPVTNNDSCVWIINCRGCY